MIRRLMRLYRRYAAHHGMVAVRALPLTAKDGTRAGYVDTVELRGGALSLTGWADADCVHLTWNGGRNTAPCDIARVDVNVQMGLRAEVGFEVSADARLAPFEVQVERGGEIVAARAIDARAAGDPLAKSRIAANFVRDAARAAPAVVGWMRTGDPRYRAAVRRALGLDTIPPAALLHPDLFRPAPPPAAEGVVIVMPVYNAFEVLCEALDRVDRHTEAPWRMILVEDRSTDDRVRPFLRAWAAARGDRVELMENAENLGFIGSVNRAFATLLGQDAPVVLLNSDALLPPAWAGRLLAPLADPSVATVTPMSNDAEIFSVPEICLRSDLPPGAAEAIDAAAATLNGAVARADAPTGVGFCMAIAPAYLRRLPSFDPIFGRGYGEEVDWCQRVRAMGGRHLGLANVFVEHRGGTSFGSAEKRALIARNGQRISQRYPTYDAEVQDFIAKDPLRGPRMVLAIAHAAAPVGETALAPAADAASLGLPGGPAPTAPVPASAATHHGATPVGPNSPEAQPPAPGAPTMPVGSPSPLAEIAPSAPATRGPASPEAAPPQDEGAPVRGGIAPHSPSDWSKRSSPDAAPVDPAAPSPGTGPSDILRDAAPSRQEPPTLFPTRATGAAPLVEPTDDGDPASFPVLDARPAPRPVIDTPGTGPVVDVYLAHTMGGGAEHFLQSQIAAAARSAVVVRVGGPRRWLIELWRGSGGAGPPVPGLSVATDSTDQVHRLLAPLRRRRVVYSCGVGDTDPYQLPTVLGDLLAPAEAATLSVWIQDYFPVSPSFTLLGADNAYRGVPDPGSADPAHSLRRPGGGRVGLADWRKAWGGAMARADEIVVFSAAARDIVAEAYPDHADRLRLRPHRLLADIPAMRGGRRDVVGVLGNIGLQKGAAVLQQLARRLQRRRLVVVGSVDPAYPLDGGVEVLGPYRREDLARIAQGAGIGVWLIPSIWPETFSYTTHEALATGLPVLAFDIGGQGEAVAAAANGHPVPLDPDGDPAAAILAALDRLARDAA